ncbi:MAG: YfiR family protein, partial [Bacteroidota bacterium]
EKGSCINFRIVNNRLKFELNQQAIQKSQLKTASQLTSMAILI